MSLLHATWLPVVPAGSFAKGKAPSAGLLIWADTWRVAEPVSPGQGATHEAPAHPLSLDLDDLATWLDDNDFWSEALRQANATLTLPSRQQGARGQKSDASDAWSGMPLQAGEPLPKDLSWWPWQVEGWCLKPGPAAEWLNQLPLSGYAEAGLGEDLRWWAHLQRWCLSLIARGRWLPDAAGGKASWLPLLNREDDRRRLEDLAARMPQFAVLISLLALASMGLPPFGVFAGFMGLLLASPLSLSIAPLVIAVTWLAASWYILDLVQRLLFGRKRPDLRYEDLRRSEFASLLIVVVIMVALGIAPTTLFEGAASPTRVGAAVESPSWNR